MNNLGFLIEDVEELTATQAIENMISMLGDSSQMYIDQFKTLSKSLDGTKQVRLIGGLAMGTTRDFEREKAILSGIDYSYIMSGQGRLNSEHNSDLIVGRPIFAGMIPNKGLYIKGILREKNDFPNPSNQNTISSLNKAEEYWELAKSHQNNPSANAPIGFSAEGQKMVEQGTVHRAIVTDVAVTARAMNPHDCTVSILAKSISQSQKQEAIQIVKSFDFPVDEIENVKDYIAHMSNKGASLKFSTDLYNKIRSFR